MKDIALKDFDIEFNNGDFDVGNAQNQSVEMLLISEQGEWKEYPEAGCGIASAKNGVIDRFLDRRIRVQLEADNFEIGKLEITEKGIELNGEYRGI